jgi:hypothetical protein
MFLFASSSRTAAVGSNQIVESVDVGVEQRKIALTTRPVLTDRGNVPRVNGLQKNMAIGTAALCRRAIADVLPHGRPANASASNLEVLSARRMSFAERGRVSCKCYGADKRSQHDYNRVELTNASSYLGCTGVSSRPRAKLKQTKQAPVLLSRRRFVPPALTTSGNDSGRSEVSPSSGRGGASAAWI